MLSRLVCVFILLFFSFEHLQAAAARRSDLYQMSLTDQAGWVSLSKESTGLVQGGRSLKFLIDQRNRNQPRVYFMNSNFAGRCRLAEACSRYHYDFAVEALRYASDLDTFNAQTYFTRSKDFVAGVLQSYVLKDRGPVIGIQLYPQDMAQEEDIVNLARILKAVVRIPGQKLAFVATGDQQSTGTVENDLAAAGILNLSLNAILGDISYIPLHTGEAYGYLRLFPSNQDDLLPTDIPVFDELPLDLSVVAATITKAYQDTNSHINLKSKERNTPNMVLRDAGPEQRDLKRWLDQPVRLVVTTQGFSITASTDAEVQARYAAKIKKPWLALKWQSTSSLSSFESICPGRAANCLKASELFGSKAANLGFLKEVFRDRTLPGAEALSYDPVPLGFAVPLQFYKDFMDLPSNAALKEKLSAFIELEKSGLMSSRDRSTQAEEIRQLILNAELPAQNLESILNQARTQAPEIDKWKLRSSANAEDIDGFDGAGLHDSYSAKVSTKDNAEHSCKLVLDDDPEPGELPKMKVKPKTFACAIKGVYASLWNKRAIEERNFARIDHASIAMGLAILPSYDTESPVVANSVVVTRVINSRDVYGYTLSIQKDNNTVTNPLPGSWSEQTIYAVSGYDEPPSLTTLRFAKPLPESPVMTTTVLPRETTIQMALMARKVEEAYCRARGRSYYPKSCRTVSWDAEKPKSLDMEMKFLQNGEFVLKQVREFGGR
ncbi:MAG TPA: PEP/pyruvate-binding domain-containing protein [Oligoflexus sp.]|uniref:PEP/pyruvate-binding domain-containing protein n=1 Tax=Oligoflexus sp. TaxID=1971216 RepID=UPI002D7F45D8|nr:PEP/pyruvate-binding domain-containing protein [Oligoflexus sp.]HET9238330.1 PEP/pyruvate-binding domain-containing protein [Oligoflexus sp.]